METKDIIKQLRKSKGYSAEYVAENSGVPTGSYKKYESGILNPGVPVIIKLAKFYNVTTDYLLGLEQPVDPFAKLELSEEDEKEMLKTFLGFPDYIRAAVLDVIRQMGRTLPERKEGSAEPETTANSDEGTKSTEKYESEEILAGEIEDEALADRAAKAKDVG